MQWGSVFSKADSHSVAQEMSRKFLIQGIRIIFTNQFFLEYSNLLVKFHTTFLWVCLVTPGFCHYAMHCIAIGYSLSVLFILIWKVLVLSALFIAFHFYVHSHSCSALNLLSAFVAWSSHFHLILYARILNFLYLVAWVSP